MAGPEFIIPWIPRLIPLIAPRSEPLVLPTTPRRPGGPPLPPKVPTVTQVPEPPAPAPPRDPARPGAPRPPKSPDEAFLPPPAPPTIPTPAPSPSVVDRTTGRYFPRSRTVRLPTLPEAASRAGLVLWVLGTLVFEPYLRGPLTRPQPSGPPRRTRRPNTAVNPDAPFEWVPGRNIYRLPQPRFPASPFPRRSPRATTTPVRTPGTVSPRPGPLPGGGTTVSPVPAPRVVEQPRQFPQPEAPLGYDPFVLAPPTPAPAARPAPRGAPRTGPRIAFPLGFPVPSAPRSVPRTRTRPLTPQQPLTPQPTPSSPPSSSRPRLPPAPRLTPFDAPVPTSQPQYRAKPTEANPCTAQREARRGRQKDCKRYTTKTIRVCADK